MVILKMEKNTKNKYNVHLKLQEIFCKDENINTSVTLQQGLDFLTHLFKKGNKYLSVLAV